MYGCTGTGCVNSHTFSPSWTLHLQNGVAALIGILNPVESMRANALAQCLTHSDCSPNCLILYSHKSKWPEVKGRRESRCGWRMKPTSLGQVGTPRASDQEGQPNFLEAPQLSPLLVKGLSLVSRGTCPSMRNKPH